MRRGCDPFGSTESWINYYVCDENIFVARVRIADKITKKRDSRATTRSEVGTLIESRFIKYYFLSIDYRIKGGHLWGRPPFREYRLKLRYRNRECL